ILSRLPEAPAPARDRRQVAILKASQQFAKKYRTPFQGSGHALRLTQQTATSIPPSRRRSIMRARHVIAASLVALIAGSAAWHYVGETRVAPKSDRPVIYREAPTKIVERLSAPEPSPTAPAPPGLAYAPQQGQ